MTDFLKELLKKEKDLTSLLDILNNNTSPVIEGRLRIANKNGAPVYYQDIYIDEKDSKSPKQRKRKSFYIRKKDRAKATALAQQDYNNKLYNVAIRQLSQIKTLIKASQSFDEKLLENVYAQMTPYRKELINPLAPDQETFVRNWLNMPFTKKPFSEYDPEIFSENGERVRSKSEKIIADKYLKEYCDSALRRVELYAKNGIFVGDQLIITHETANRPMNMTCCRTSNTI